MEPELSDIQRFYKNATVFLTGVTGLIGKLVLEKVLRALPVKRVFVLVKDGGPSDIFESPAFEVLKRSNPEAFDKVTMLEGDCALPLLGVAESHIETLLEEVNVVFHCASTVAFNETIQTATRTNVRGTKDLIDLAKKMKNLKTFVYVGTAFSNSNQTEIKEEICPSNVTAEGLILACETLGEECLNSVTKTLIGDWPNTDTFTKQVTEDYINREAKNLPISVTRPTIVTSTSMEPVQAYVESAFTFAGLVLVNALGICHIAYHRDTNLDIVPADYVVNECIAAGWYTGEAFRRQRGAEIPVFNISSMDNPIRQDDLYGLCDYYGRAIPPTKLMAYPLYFRTTCKQNYLFLRFFFHTMIGFIMDLALKAKGHKPLYEERMKKLHDFQESYEPFTTNNFYIHTENTRMLLKKMSFRDRELFNFDVQTLNWDTYFSQYVKGIRFYLTKEPMDTIPEGLKRYRYLKRVMILSLVVVAVVLYVVGKVVLFRLLPFVLGIITYSSLYLVSYFK